MNVGLLLFLRSLALLYGFFSLLLLCFIAILDGYILQKPGKDIEQRIVKARKDLWDLSKGYHGFITLSTGLKLHYICNDKPDSLRRKNLIVLVHGWPNSCMLWKSLLTPEKFTADEALVAVDLPAFGLSGPLPDYGPNQVLDAVAEFVVRVIDMHMTSSPDGNLHGKVILVGHDWGCIIATRLASEAPMLADRFILSNAFLPALATANVAQRLRTTKQLWNDWLSHPAQFHLIQAAIKTAKPILSQVRKSFYVFVFQLPWPLCNVIGSLGNHWFLRLASLGAMRQKDPGSRPDMFAELMAGSLGSVERPVRWYETIRLYQDGLLANPWTKSDTVDELLASANSRSARTPPPKVTESGAMAGAANAKVTVIWGAYDAAIENEIALKGIEDFLADDSQLIMLHKAGHWTPVDRDGPVVFEQVIRWAIVNDKEDIGVLLQRAKVNASVAVAK